MCSHLHLIKGKRRRMEGTRKEEIIIGGWLDGETEDKEEKMKSDNGKYNKN